MLPFFGEALTSGERLGDMLGATLDAVDPAMLAVNSINRWMQSDYVLLGDPTLPLIDPELTDVAAALPSPLQVTASPNPFNPLVRIAFSMEAATGTVSVSVDVYDLGGRHVANVLRASLGSGRHGAIWDGRGDDGLAVAAGTYVARVQVGKRARTVKLACVR